MFPKGPPHPLHLLDDDVPICDSSGQIQLSMLVDEDKPKNIKYDKAALKDLK